MMFRSALVLGVLSYCAITHHVVALDYAIVDTSQDKYFGNSDELATVPAEGEDFYGQDAHYTGNPPNYVNNGDETISDIVTGLMWTANYDAQERISWETGQSSVSSCTTGGYSDWRVPTIKELYSLIDFRGTDPPSGDDSVDLNILTPFIDTTYFQFSYGTEIGTGFRVVDFQGITSTSYVDEDMGSPDPTLADWFGVNFADGRIKGYSKGRANFFAFYVRGNTNYGVNDFLDNGDETISDRATGLMWEKQDSGGSGMNWQSALAHCEARTTATHTDWRLPNAKELNSIIDYTRGPESTSSAAIDAVFDITSITNENNVVDWPYFWTSTTHIKSSVSIVPGTYAAYFSFGRAIGKFDYDSDSVEEIIDVHGAGSQKADPKTGSPSFNGPQGDAERINNHVRCVRTETEGTYPTSAPTSVPTSSAAPSAEPTAAPTPFPTPHPTSAPTVLADTPSCGCFSAATTVHVAGRGVVSMTDLRVNDLVLTNQQRDQFQPVYGFGHVNPTFPMEFLQIYTKGSNKPLELTGNHLIWLVGNADPVRADTLQTGDKLVQKRMGHPPTEVRITKIATITRQGVYLPLTPDGTLIVNDGIQVSAYVSIKEYTPRIVDHTTTLVSQQLLFHWWLAPYRMMCMMGISPSLCDHPSHRSDTTNNNQDAENRHPSAEEGITYWLALGKKVAEFGEKQSLPIQILGLTMVGSFLAVFVFAEYVFGPKLGAAVLLFSAALILARRTNKAKMSPKGNAF